MELTISEQRQSLHDKTRIIQGADCGPAVSSYRRGVPMGVCRFHDASRQRADGVAAGVVVVIVVVGGRTAQATLWFWCVLRQARISGTLAAVCAGFFSSKPAAGAVTADLAATMQGVLEGALLRNIQLQDDVATLSDEVARLQASASGPATVHP